MVSVCMISYNGEKYIKEQLISILEQLKPDDEVIISDDGSTDATCNIINSLHDNRIRLLHHTQKKSRYSGIMDICYKVGRNAENALKEAKGDYIFLADQDDIWLPGKVEASIKAMQDANLVITSHIKVDGNLQKIECSGNPNTVRRPTLYSTLTNTSFIGCCMAFKKDLLKYILPFPKEPLMQDIWVGLMSLKHGKIALIQKPFLKYRRHGNNVSVNGEKSPNPISFKLMYRYYILKAYIQN